MSLMSTFGHVAKHTALHAAWMVPMAAVMMMPGVAAAAGAAAGAGPALGSTVVGSLDMMLTNGFNFFADGAFSTLIENTLNGVFWDPSYAVGDGSMSMAGHGIEHGADHAKHVVEHAVASVEGHVEDHVGHCTMDTHGAVFDRWSEENHGGFLSAVLGGAPSPSEQWSQFSEVLCPK